MNQSNIEKGSEKKDTSDTGPELPVRRENDPDEALQAYEALGGGPIVLDAATDRRLLWKIDAVLMPILFTVYALNFLDKTTLSYASVMGLKQDLHLVGADYSWLGSVFYFGYLGWEYPTNLLLQRLPLAKYSAFSVIMWGVTLCCFAAVRNYPGAIAVRFFLGVFEASVTPGFALFTSQWYTKREQGARTAIWASANGFAQIFGGLVAYRIAVNDKTHHYSISPWKIEFLVAGAVTIVAGFVFLIVVPDSQLNAWWLSKQDRVLAIERLRLNQQGIGNKHFKLYQLKEALLDPIAWSFVFLALVLDIPNGGLTNFFSQLIVSFGFTAEESLLYGAPGGAVEIIALLGWGFLTQRYGHRLILAVSGMSIAALGAILIVALPLANRDGRLAGYYLTQFSAVGFVGVLSLISTNVAGYTKRTTVAAMYLIAYCVGNIIGPQTFRSQDAPRYKPAEITIIVCYMLAIFGLVFVRWYYQKQNRVKAALTAHPEYRKLENQEFQDLTDIENPEFRYEL